MGEEKCGNSQKKLQNKPRLEARAQIPYRALHGFGDYLGLLYRNRENVIVSDDYAYRLGIEVLGLVVID